jgi:hypothetical protein
VRRPRRSRTRRRQRRNSARQRRDHGSGCPRRSSIRTASTPPVANASTSARVSGHGGPSTASSAPRAPR